MERPSSAEAIDRFVDALWIEDGLAAQSLAAYRRDLAALAAWLGQRDRRLVDAGESDLREYAVARHGASAASSVNRRLAVFRRFYRWALRERLTDADPTLRLAASRQPLRVPKSLS